MKWYLEEILPCLRNRLFLMAFWSQKFSKWLGWNFLKIHLFSNWYVPLIPHFGVEARDKLRVPSILGRECVVLEIKTQLVKVFNFSCRISYPSSIKCYVWCIGWENCYIVYLVFWAAFPTSDTWKKVFLSLMDKCSATWISYKLLKILSINIFPNHLFLMTC